MIEPDSGLRESYRLGGLDGHLPLGETPAMLVVDAARAYLDSESPLFADVPEVGRRIARLLLSARQCAIPVFFTRVEFKPGGEDGGIFYQKVPALRCFEAGSDLGAFATHLEPIVGEAVITKQFASSFFGTDLAERLASRRIDTLVITGFSTSGCVRASAVDAIQHGFIPVVVVDAVGDRHPAPHAASLFDLESKYAELRDSDWVSDWFETVGRPRPGDCR